MNFKHHAIQYVIDVVTLCGGNDRIGKKKRKKYHARINGRHSVYPVALIQPGGSSIVVTHRTSDVRVTSDIPVTLGLVPVELSTIISASHAATYVIKTYVS